MVQTVKTAIMKVTMGSKVDWNTKLAAVKNGSDHEQLKMGTSPISCHMGRKVNTQAIHCYCAQSLKRPIEEQLLHTTACDQVHVVS